ncbi:FixH family protein [Sphingobacterium spiritivorum]|uniref:FixH family protein n=1 Tax=Sphingobacterium spiritivorum TaxID=258 RepID=UPI001F1D7095|nr:FixH family protein [Sphingobacterium spiritivorum]
MIKNNLKAGFLGMICLIFIYSCGDATKSSNLKSEYEKDTVNQIIDFSKLISRGDTLLGNRHVSLWSMDSLYTGYETLYLKVADTNGNAVPDMGIDYRPVMHMGMMSHAGPFQKLISKGSGIYQADVVFIMANMEGMGKGWQFHTFLTEHGKTDTLSFDLPVKEAKYARTLPTGTKDDGRVFVSCLLPAEIKKGSNPIRFVIHKTDKDRFPELDGYSITLEPFMPAMGHGSSGNKNAEGTGGGRYEGTVQLSMPGEWLIKATLLKDGNVVSQDSLVFPVEVK